MSGQEQAWAAGSRHSAWSLPDVLSANSSRRRVMRPSVDAPSEHEEQMDDYEQLVNAALEKVPASRRSMVSLCTVSSPLMESSFVDRLVQLLALSLLDQLPLCYSMLSTRREMEMKLKKTAMRLSTCASWAKHSGSLWLTEPLPPLSSQMRSLSANFKNESSGVHFLRRQDAYCFNWQVASIAGLLAPFAVHAICITQPDGKLCSLHLH